MGNIVTPIALNMLVAGCVSSGKVSVNREQLQCHHFVLQSVDGKAATVTNPPELSFGESMMVSGKMCDQLRGQGKLSDGESKIKSMAMARMMCADPQLNALGGIVSEAFKQGAQVDLTTDRLTLTTTEQMLTYKLADLMQEAWWLNDSHNFRRQVTAHYSVRRWVAHTSRQQNHPVDEQQRADR